MNNTRRQILAIGAAAAAVPTWASSSVPYPNKPITLTVPFSKGGSTDIVARIIAPTLSQVIGQPVTVKNIAGAGGTVGAQALANADSNGYTLGMATVSTTGTGPIVRKTIGYDPLDDFASIIKLVDVPGVISVHPSFPAKNFREFINVVQRNPGRYTYASSGSGGVQHMGMELFKIRNKLYLLHMPYKGAGPALRDVVAGRIEIMWDNLSSSLPHIKAGRLRPIGLVADKRSERLPDLPTFGELGVVNYHAATYFGVLAPVGISQSVEYSITRALDLVMNDASVRQALINAGGSPVGGGADVLRGQIVSELRKWGEVARYAKVEV
jgi:tripartite-type tricarboxylate transporter receptor subunit TctC